VPDGHLFRAVAAELYQVAVESDIDVINTYYIDPHAARSPTWSRTRLFECRAVASNQVRTGR
jgi:hypothetical protein